MPTLPLRMVDNNGSSKMYQGHILFNWQIPMPMDSLFSGRWKRGARLKINGRNVCNSYD